LKAIRKTKAMNSYKKLLSLTIILLLAAAALPGCMKQVNMNSMRPAALTVPPYVQTLLILDRTEYENERLAIIEGVLTGEGLAEDKNGIQEAINSFQQQVMSSPRFTILRANERMKGNSLIGAFPDPLSWTQIESLCRKYNADAVVAIELFDTNFLITDGKKNVKKEVVENGVKKQVDVVEYYAEGVATTKIGFRLYDPEAKTIADQEMFSKANTWQGTGTSIKDAMAKLIQKSEATRYVSQLAGSSYAQKITPMPITISRQFYAKPKDNQYMSAGSRYAEVNQWEQAIKSWTSGMVTADAKTAGRLSYNIAVAYEVIGDYGQAKDWATKSYVRFGNKNARQYASMLEQRIIQEEIVNEQMRVEEKPKKTESEQPKLKLKVKN